LTTTFISGEADITSINMSFMRSMPPRPPKPFGVAMKTLKGVSFPVISISSASVPSCSARDYRRRNNGRRLMQYIHSQSFCWGHQKRNGTNLLVCRI
jgi:hypothetical protein